MIDDTRGATWSYSAEIILEPMKNIGTDPNGYPMFIFYKTPSIQITKVRRVLLEPTDIDTLKATVIANANKFEGKDVIKSFSSGSDFIVVGKELYYPGSITYIDYPEKGDWNPPPEDIQEYVLTSIVGYDSALKPFSAGEYKGKRVTKKYTEPDSILDPSEKQGLSGNRIYTKFSPSNYRNINGKVYRDVTVEYIEF